jgi:hypothetical protein
MSPANFRDDIPRGQTEGEYLSDRIHEAAQAIREARMTDGRAGGTVTNKQYLGDGVYVDIDERGLLLTTENGIEVTNTIVLEPEVWEALQRYLQRMLALTKEE